MQYYMKTRMKVAEKEINKRFTH